MPGTSIETLPRPRKPRRVDRDTERPDGECAFPSERKAQEEDRFRAKRLARYECSNRLQTMRAHKLGQCLERGLRTGEPQPTLASSLYHRELRIPILSAVWERVAVAGADNAAFITLRPQGMLYEGDELAAVKPGLLGKRLRNDFNRCGVTAAGGWAFVGLDAEFDANRGTSGVWDFHWHGILVGEKIDAIEALRDMDKYDEERQHPLEHELAPSPRVRVQKGLYNLPAPFNYCLDSWVPHRPTTLVGPGKRERSNVRSGS